MLLIWALLGAVASAAESFEDYPPNYNIKYVNTWAQPNATGYLMREEHMDYLCDIKEPSQFNSLQDNNATQLALQKSAAIDAVRAFNWKHRADCIYRELGYWSYRACFSQDFTQFHYTGDRQKVHESLETDTSIPAHRLGYMKDSTKQSEYEFVKLPDGSRYLSQLVHNGSMCDLTGRDRSVFVQYKCNPAHKVPVIATVEELKTCQYRLVIAGAELCEYDVLQPKNYVAEANITCQPVRPNDAELKEMMYDDENDQDLLDRHQKLDLTTFKLYPIGEGIFMGIHKDPALTVEPAILFTNKMYRGGFNDTDTKVKEKPQAPQEASPNATISANQIQLDEDETDTSLLRDIGMAFANLLKTNKLLAPDSVQPRRPVRKGDAFEYVAEVFGLDREYIGNVAISQRDTDYIVAHFVPYGAARTNFVSFTPVKE